MSTDANVRDASWNDLSLIPGLPNDVALLCLAKVARVAWPKLRLVCTSWKHLFESKEFYDLRFKVGSAEAWLYVLTEKPSGAPFKAYSPRLNKWFALPPTLTSSSDSRWQGFACVASGSTLLLMGGMHQRFDAASQGYLPGVVSGDVQVYNACRNQWSKGASMNTPRSWYAAAVIGDCVYVAGGQGKDRFLNSVEVYDSKTNQWSFAPNMICVRSSCYGLAFHGKFWVIGGELMRNHYGEKPERGSAEVYDPETGVWTLIPEMWLDTQKVEEEDKVAVLIKALPDTYEQLVMVLKEKDLAPTLEDAINSIQEEEQKLGLASTVPANTAYMVAAPEKRCYECGKTNHLAKDCYMKNPCIHCGGTNHPSLKGYFNKAKEETKCNTNAKDKGKGKVNFVDSSDEESSSNVYVSEIC